MPNYDTSMKSKYFRVFLEVEVPRPHVSNSRLPQSHPRGHGEPPLFFINDSRVPSPWERRRVSPGHSGERDFCPSSVGVPLRRGDPRL